MLGFLMQQLYKQIFSGPFGNMCAIASATHVLALFFKDNALREPKWMGEYAEAENAICAPLEILKKELALYFNGQLQQFKTPVLLKGSEFELDAWNALQRIPYGQTISYLEQANSMNRPKAFRAVGSANGRNRLSILIPCHRVVKVGGSIGGYAGGVGRKQKLIALESRGSVI